MKHNLIILSVIISLIVSCGNDTKSENEKLFEACNQFIPNIQKNSEVYLVHPENCGACSVDLIKRLSKKASSHSIIYVLSTSAFPEEYDSIVDHCGLNIKIVEGEPLYRKGILQDRPQKLKLIDGKITSIYEINPH